MVEKKSDSLSDKYRAEGNQSFAKKKFFDALMFYNKVRKKTCAGSFHKSSLPAV